MTTRREFLGAFAAPLIFSDSFEDFMPIITIQPPIGGMNTLNAYTAMPPTDAVCLVDAMPEGTYIESAPPCDEYMSATGNVRSIIPYEAGSTTKLLAEINNSGSIPPASFLDITVPGAPVTLEANMSGYPFIWTMFQSKLIVMTGDYMPQVFNGTTCSDISVTGPADETLIRGGITFKGRVYYWVINEQAFWYAAAGSYQGALTQFPLDTITSKGGEVEFLTTITRDGGEGADDLFVIVFNTGEVLVYQGDDPGSASAWEIIGKFQIPRPCGARSWLRLGGRTIVRTIEGVVDLNAVLAGENYPLLGTKIGSLLSYKIAGVPTSRDTRDLIGVFDSPELGSLVFNTMGTGDILDWKILADEHAPCIKKNSMAAWLYSGPCIPLAGGFANSIRHAAVYKGRTYFGTSSYVFVINQGSGQTEVMSDAWEPVSSFGYSFSVNPGAFMNESKAVIKNYVAPTQAGTYPAFVAPFGGLSGQLTLRQDIIGTIEDVWTGFPYPDKKRWYGTNIRLKAGGKR